MVIIWRGKGFVIGLVAIACVGLASAITSVIAGDAYTERHTWWGLAGFWAAAALVMRCAPGWAWVASAR